MTIEPADRNIKGSWELFCQEGEMKLYTREIELDDGTIVDPLRAVHTVDRISGRELITRFWNTDVRLEWELTIETCKVCEVNILLKIDKKRQ
jgi:collagen type IV alpha-3-binding protein